MYHRMMMEYVPKAGDPLLIDITKAVADGRLRFLFDLQEKPPQKIADATATIELALDFIEEEYDSISRPDQGR